MVLNHSFSVDQTSFLVKLLMVSFFPLWPKSSRMKSKSFIFFGSIVFRFGSPSLALLVQTGGICQTNSNYNFSRRYWRCNNMVTCFSHTSHTCSMTGPYFCCLFNYYPKLVEWILYWLRFFIFSSDDTVFTSWEIVVLQMLKLSWSAVTVCFTILIVTKVFAT